MKRLILILGIAFILVGLVQPYAGFPPPPKVQAQKTSHVQPIQAAKLPEPTPTPIPQAQAVTTPVQAPQPQPVVIDGCGDNQYANYIYSHESGCNTQAQNSIGCLGIGQACPGSKLTAVCPNLDYACENQFFTDYAIGRYGSWEAAYYFWVNNHWW